MSDTTTNVLETAKTVTAPAAQLNTTAKPAAIPPAPPVNAAPQDKRKTDPRFVSFQWVKMRLIKEGTMQYDPSYPDLKLNSAAKEGVLMPLTPFFASKIGSTIELILD